MSEWREAWKNAQDDGRLKEFNLADAVQDALGLKGSQMPADAVLAMTIKWLHNEVMSLRADFDKTRYAEGDVLIEALREDNAALRRRVLALENRLFDLESPPPSGR